MPKKKRRGPGRPPKSEVVESSSRLHMSDETKHSIIVVMLLVLAVLMILSMFGLTGQFGVWVVKGLRIMFGAGYALFPILLGFFGVLLINDEKYHLGGLNYLGIALLSLGYCGLFHIKVPLAESSAEALAGMGGGYVGWFATFPLMSVMDFWGTLVVLLALLVIGIFLSFNISIEDIRNRGSQTISLWSKLSSWLLVRFNKDAMEKIEEVEEEYETDEEVYEEADEEEGEYEEEEEEEEYEGDEQVSEPISGETEVLVSSEHVDIDIPIKLLKSSSSKPTSGDIEATKEKIQQTFENFNIDVEMGDVSVGPTVTQYTLAPAEGVKLSRIVALNNDLALALAAHPIRIEAPIPGKSLVGIEVPNKAVATVSLREVIDSKEFETLDSRLPVALGKDVTGKTWTLTIEKLPHLLIAGATGSGKSVCINTLLMSLLYRNSPDELKLILVDPKRVELSLYNGIPYLLTPVITDTQKTINALRWAVAEMDKRYQALSEVGKRNIADYNAAHPEYKLPYIVIVIDELADLMAVAAQEVEGAIVRLAQMARAVGIHLVLATQRPSVDVITGLIKANITSRIAFAVASQTDSRTILDMSGAEKLLGRGDMLLITAEFSKPKRLQGAFVTDDEVSRVMQFIKKNAPEAEYHEEITKPKQSSGLPGDVGGDADSLLPEARRLVIEAGKASASYLQRRLRIGYSRAARLLDYLEEEGTIGPADGSRPREVLVSKEDFQHAAFGEEVDHDNEESEETEEEVHDADAEDTDEYGEDDDDTRTV
ncbi:MAG: DNA translocase FtsK 4TM domain-containing protein [Patescibacteria group bacterium]